MAYLSVKPPQKSKPKPAKKKSGIIGRPVPVQGKFIVNKNDITPPNHAEFRKDFETNIIGKLPAVIPSHLSAKYTFLKNQEQARKTYEDGLSSTFSCFPFTDSQGLFYYIISGKDQFMGPEPGYIQSFNQAYFQNGSHTIWPPINGGVLGTVEEITLPEHTKLNRIGDEGGCFLTLAEERSESFEHIIPTDAQEERALRPLTVRKAAEHLYEVLKPLSVSKAKISGWFNETGGGIQYSSSVVSIKNPSKKANVQELRERGFLKEITKH